MTARRGAPREVRPHWVDEVTRAIFAVMVVTVVGLAFTPAKPDAPATSPCIIQQSTVNGATSE